MLVLDVFIEEVLQILRLASYRDYCPAHKFLNGIVLVDNSDRDVEVDATDVESLD